MQIWSMVVFMAKCAVATISAVIILIVIGRLVLAGVGMRLGAGWYHWEWGSGLMLKKRPMMAPPADVMKVLDANC